MNLLVAIAAIVFDTVLCAASLNAHGDGDIHRSMMLFALATVVSIGAAMFIMTEHEDTD